MEIWKSSLSAKGYLVSDQGNVKGLKRNKTLSPFISNSGYYRVTIGNMSKFSIHRLVAEAFIPNPENKQQVNHKNGIKTDNRVDNLEWTTSHENMKHAYESGLVYTCRGEEKSKFSNKDVSDIKELRSIGVKLKDIATRFEVSLSTVSRICNGVRWRHHNV